MNTGYIKIWRRLEDSGLLQMPNTLALFVFLLMRSMHKDCKVGTAIGVIELKRGQYISGRSKLASDLNQSEREIRTSLARLQELQIIDQQTTSRYSIYTIVNYEKYQGSDQQTTSTSTSRRPADDQQTTTKEECKELKNVKNTKNISASALLASLGVCESVADDWIAVRKSKKAAITKTALEGIASEAAKAGMSIECALKVCCERGWSGFKASWVLDKAPAQTKSAQLDTADQIFRRGKYGNDGQIADFDSIRSVESSGARIPETLDGVWKSNALEVERIEDGGCLSGLGGSDAGFDA